jgi:soluble lytic murein transglycosylase-like protein
MRLLVRLFVLALAVPALAQPALAREHSRHHHWARAIHSQHHVARSFERYDTQRRFVPDDGRPVAERREGHGELDTMIARHAQMNGLPEALVHRVVIRESRYSPRVIGAGGAMGLMQIKYGTAREMGYTGSPAGLLDAETNLTYAVRYLAGAYRVAGGNADRAVANYAHGYRDVTAREGVAPPRRVASNETRAWSGSYASAGPVDRVAQAGSGTRRDNYSYSAFDRQLDGR